MTPTTRGVLSTAPTVPARSPATTVSFSMRWLLMRPDQKLIRAAMMLRAAHHAAWAEFVLALTERAQQRAADVVAARPEDIMKAQGAAQSLTALVRLLHDAPQHF